MATLESCTNSVLQDSQKSNIILPFLKWAGGKRWLVEKFLELINYEGERYIEPFLGSGAVFFGISPSTAILSDTNKDLIDTYIALRDNWQGVSEILHTHHNKHSKLYYYKVRSEPTDSLVEKAAKFIYLNRTCWNGLYRVNLQGAFNVPIGTKKNVVLKTDDFEQLSHRLKAAKFFHQDFSKTMFTAGLGDIVYVDPPYTVRHNNNGFIKYNESLFSWDDQVRLRYEVERAVDRGAKVIVSNADHESICDLYSGIGEMFSLSRNSSISGRADRRGTYGELLIRCF